MDCLPLLISSWGLHIFLMKWKYNSSIATRNLTSSLRAHSDIICVCSSTNLWNDVKTTNSSASTCRKQDYDTLNTRRTFDRRRLVCCTGPCSVLPHAHGKLQVNKQIIGRSVMKTNDAVNDCEICDDEVAMTLITLQNVEEHLRVEELPWYCPLLGATANTAPKMTKHRNDILRIDGVTAKQPALLHSL